MVITAGGLALLAAVRPSTPGLLALLAVVGIGLGLFTPSNNAAIMGAAPREHAGVASGVLNMTRGVGTALGLAVTGLIFGASGGQAVAVGSLGRAFSVTAFTLAGVALVAAMVAATRPQAPHEVTATNR
jgi:MFS family permease